MFIHMNENANAPKTQRGRIMIEFALIISGGVLEILCPDPAEAQAKNGDGLYHTTKDRLSGHL